MFPNEAAMIDWSQPQKPEIAIYGLNFQRAKCLEEMAICWGIFATRFHSALFEMYLLAWRALWLLEIQTKMIQARLSLRVSLPKRLLLAFGNPPVKSPNL
jgi:hypothetical protein